MKVIILAGGYGTRLETMTEAIPKPMVTIGERPILWHVMKGYAHYGYRDFVLALGYKGQIIKDYFTRYDLYHRDCTVDLATRDVQFHPPASGEEWTVTLVETGLTALKGARIKRAAKYLTDDTNLLTYGDGLGDVDIRQLVEFHRSHGKVLTITGVFPPSLFGEILEEQGRIVEYQEKPQTSRGFINGGFMVFEKGLLDYLEAEDDCDLESGAVERLVRDGEAMVYRHPGQWLCMDTPRDREYLNRLWREGNAFWKVWD